MDSEQLLEMLAAATLNLYRLSMVAGGGGYTKQLRESLMQPEPGDLVLNVNDWQSRATNRIGRLLEIINCNDVRKAYLVIDATGNQCKWNHAIIVKVLQQPFNATS